MDQPYAVSKIYQSLLLMVVLGATASVASAQVGVSVGISQPGVYGRINIGDFPPPPVIVQRPIVIAPQPYVEQRQPIYLYVPAEHQKNWGNYCGRYGACGQPVYFVQEQWVRDRYEHDHPNTERRGRGGNGHGDHRRNDGDHGRHGEDRGHDGGDRGDEDHRH